MRIFVHRYTLVPRKRLSGVAREGAREGALLRVGEGFADLHPWPELGDLPLDAQLDLLARGEPTPQAEASLQLARLDEDARRRGVSLFEGLTIPQSHWPGSVPPPEFDTVKVKNVAEAPRDVRVRIDLNATLTADEFLRVAASLDPELVDFVEDPCPYDPVVWQMLRDSTRLRLALDRVPATGVIEPATYDVRVFKPALQSCWPDDETDVVVTSYMDHPIGQYGAALMAATHRVNARCGLFTHVLYEPDAFLERVRSDGARLLAPGGTGIGFDDLLERLTWTSIG